MDANHYNDTTCDAAAEAAAARIVRILDEYLEELKAGRAPSREELIARHPQFAGQLEACLAGLEFLHAAESPAAGPQRLGDFRLLREVGRGGMGAVFEAEQISLGRRVALKILRFGSVSDPEALERFQREAETVARLHHTNIVPIFAVGSERGVNYYAMQFIEGRSLAEALAQSQGPLLRSLLPERVAQWGLQAAEALAHAHQRGVIHRDVKPSNLLLDGEDRLWLTDFGLARRMDDVTLSLTGALLGTPRYMSPEQALASKRKVDHRSDLFSLGATLYELLTGRPAFAGDTPHDVIQQILSGEPTPIRQLRPSVPRDLETIVHKCLSKEPGQRYAAARDLADDLRAFLEGRPIRARRASALELAARWAKQQQRSVKFAAAVAAVTLVAVTASLAGWSRYDAWRQASIKLGAAVPPLVAQILNQRDEVLRVETAPMQNAVSLPAGDYRVRVTSQGTLSQTFDVALTRGSEHVHTLDLRDQMLALPQEMERTLDVVDLGEQRGIVLLNEKGVGLRTSGAPHEWSIELSPESLPRGSDAPGFRWQWRGEGHQQYSGYGVFDRRPWVSPRAIDLNGDGNVDFLVAARHQAWLMAVSASGNVVWFAGRGSDVIAPPVERPSAWGMAPTIVSSVVGTPITDFDCNGDGVRDVIATFIDTEGATVPATQARQSAQRWIEAISGASGQTLWRYDLPDAWFDLPPGEEPPYDLQWFTAGSGYTQSGGNFTTGRRHVVRDRTRHQRTGSHVYLPAGVALVSLDGAPRLAIVAGTRYAALDPASGMPVTEPAELAARPARCQWADVDGDGSDDLVLIEEIAPAAFISIPTTRLVVWSPARGKQLWSQTLEADWPQHPTWTIEAPQWPLVVDLNGDGKSEIVVPDGRLSSNRALAMSGGGAPWGELVVLAGDSGQPLWTRRLPSMFRQVDHFVAGPDIDGDGWREIYAASLTGTDHRLYVDALSGQDGRTLWTASHAPPASNDTSRKFHLWQPQWWHGGADGWPQLIVHMAEESFGERQSMVAVFSAGTGKLSRVGMGITTVRPADIDGDGAEDLLVFVGKSDTALDQGGRLHCIRGVAGEAWARLGTAGEPAADFDGDGVIDLLAGWPEMHLSATSGRTGQVLWRVKLAEDLREFRFRPAGGDLNGDGVEDILAWSHTALVNRTGTPLFALSGKTGRRLWTSADVAVQRVFGVLAAQARDLDGDGRPEVLWLLSCDYGYPLRNGFSSHESQLWLFVTSGQTGALRWSAPLSPQFGLTPGNGMQFNAGDQRLSLVTADLDGDGVLDVLAPAMADGGTLETHAKSGQDGRLLWRRPFPLESGRQVSPEYWVPPVACDLDGDGRLEAVLIDVASLDDPAKGPVARIVALSGDDGAERWSWTSDVAIGYWHSGQREPQGAMMRPRVLRGPGGPRIGVFLPGNSGGKLVVLEADGTPHQRAIAAQPQPPGWWPCDADGDGIDEVAFFDDRLLCLAPADRLDEPRWQTKIGTWAHQRIVTVLSGEGEQPPSIVVTGDYADNSMSAYDAASGQRRWACAGPIPRHGDGTAFSLPEHIALLGGKSGEAPHVYYAYSGVSRVRRAAEGDELRSVPRAQPHLAGLAADPRWQRDLPWKADELAWKEGPYFVAWGLLFSATLIILPGGYAGYLVVRRQFGLRTLLLLPLVAAVFLMAAMMKGPADHDFRGLLNRMGIGLVLAPVFFYVGLLVVLAIRRQWRHVAFWLGLTVAISAVLAAIILTSASLQSPLLPDERYDLSGWYWIWFPGTFMTAWLATAAVPALWAAKTIWRRWHGGRPGTSSQSPVASGQSPVARSKESAVGSRKVGTQY